MMFSDTDTHSGILQNIELESGLGSGYITANASPDYPKYRFLTLINNWLHLVNHWIHEVDVEATYDDVNHDSFPIETYYFATVLASADTSLMTVGDTVTGQTSGATGVIRSISDDVSISISVTDGTFEAEVIKDEDLNACTITAVTYQQDYGLDSDISAVRKIEIHDASKDADDGWSNLDFMLSTDVPDNPFVQDIGTPDKYWIDGQSIMFNTAIDTESVDQYRVTYDRHAHLFVIGDTTATPGFAVPFHPILVYGAILDWASPKKDKKELAEYCHFKLFGSKTFGQEVKNGLGLKEQMQKYYSKRTEEFVAQVRRKTPSGGSWE